MVEVYTSGTSERCIHSLTVWVKGEEQQTENQILKETSTRMEGYVINVLVRFCLAQGVGRGG